MNVSILDYGAQEGGIVNCAQAIQAAVDAVSADGGGQVVIPPGRFLSGSVLLKSHVDLHLSSGACLISSLREEEIQPFPCDPEDRGTVDGASGGFFLGAAHQHDITLSGDGTIDGQGRLVFQDMDVDSGFHECPKKVCAFRPRMILFEDVENLTIRDLTLRDAAFWTLHMAGCRHVRIRDIRILNDDRGANNDGIDPDSCQDVLISGCFISTGDDAIVVKATAPMTRRYGPSEHITISNCVLHSRDSALKIGTETWGDIRNIILSDCVVDRCSRAVGIWVRDGATVENIMVHHLTGCTLRYADAYDLPGAPGWWGKGEPVFVSCTPRKKDRPYPGRIRHLSFDHLQLSCESSLFLGGETASPIEDVRFADLNLTFQRMGTQKGGFFDEQPSVRHVYSHAIPALYARSVKGLQVRDSTVRFVGMGEAWGGMLTELEDCDEAVVQWSSQEAVHV